jgi:hypothetical protein
VKRKLKVVAKRPTAPALPIAQSSGESRRAAIERAIEISMTPMPSETARALPIAKVQASSGLCAISPWIPFASAA